MKNFEYLLFDLDGTLTASAEGIVNSVIYALKKNGIEETDREKLLAFVGPPLIDSFEKYYGMNREQATKLAGDYREYFRERGWKENAVYEGIPEVLAQLKADGKHLILATAKPEPFARQIMDYFDLSKYFELICGSTFDGRITQKGEVIASVIGQIGAEHKDQMLMIGDREHDVNGAAENGIPCMGVLYGYGDREELTNAGALILCPDVQSIPEMISKLGDW